MASIIKASESHAQAGASFNLNDVVHRANQYLEDVQHQADQIRATALDEAEQIRQRAEQQGRHAALAAVDQMLQERVAAEMKTLVPALQRMVEETELLKQSWQSHWRETAIHLATSIAEKIIRRELNQRPQLADAIVAEALELAAGASEVTIRLNPVDYSRLGEARGTLGKVLARLSSVEFVEDDTITAGGCLIDTRHGRIDAQVESQLARIESELNR